MRYLYLWLSMAMLFIALLTPGHASAQDKVYMKWGKPIEGKVVEISKHEVKMYRSEWITGGPVYTIAAADIDYIIYSNGDVEHFYRDAAKKLKENIPQLNTWTFDLAGFLYNSVSQSYEHRIKQGKIGLRIPLYVGYFGGSVPGEGAFLPGEGLIYPYARKSSQYLSGPAYGNANLSKGFSIASGLNPKFYMFRHRIIRVFAGPEATIGYSRVYESDYNSGLIAHRNCTVAAMGKVGLAFTPVDKFSLVIDGGAGVGDVFGAAQAAGFIGLWHIGFSMGTNF